MDGKPTKVEKGKSVMDGWKRSTEVEKRKSILPIKKRSLHVATDVPHLEEGYDSSDSVEVANSDRVVICLSDSDEETEAETMEAVCRCRVESGYLADGETSDRRRYYTSIVTQEPRRKRRVEASVEDKSEIVNAKA